MQVIKLSATDSTNTYLKRLSRREQVPDMTVVWAVDQQAGRGQPGNQWVTEKGKNLTFSILKEIERLPATRHFLLNALVSLALLDTLQSFKITGLRVKWPNDIMSGGKKLCGILIENQLKGSFITQSIIGIGLNVNQREFPGLHGAASLSAVTGREYDLDEVLTSLLESLRKQFEQMKTGSYEDFLHQYERYLFLKDEPASYQSKGGPVFQGIIRGVYPDGRLKLESHAGSLKPYAFKEVRYLL